MLSAYGSTKTARFGLSLALGTLVILLSPVSAALGGAMVENGIVIQITGELDGGVTESWSIPLPLNWSFSNEHTWTPGGTVTVMHGEEALFDLWDVSVTLVADPAVDLTFAVKNRATSVQSFTVNSAVISFDPLVNNWAYATAGVTLTDSTTNGATMTGLQSGAKAYEAKYNGSTVFADLVSGFSVTGGTLTNTERYPVVDTVMIPGSVSSISSQFKFSLTPGDSASGTSSFVVGAIPEPATLVLLALGAAAMGARRRR